MIKDKVFTEHHYLCFAVYISGLTMHASILAYMFNLVEEGKITTVLNPASPTNNQVFIQEYVANLLKTAFPHLQEYEHMQTHTHAIFDVEEYTFVSNTCGCVPVFCFSAQVKVFVTGLFSLNQDIPAFKEHLRDFLVQIKVRLSKGHVMSCATLCSFIGHFVSISLCDCHDKEFDQRNLICFLGKAKQNLTKHCLI